MTIIYDINIYILFYIHRLCLFVLRRIGVVRIYGVLFSCATKKNTRPPFDVHTQAKKIFVSITIYLINENINLRTTLINTITLIRSLKTYTTVPLCKK